MTSLGHAHSERRRYDMACRVTRERALNVAEKLVSTFLYGAYSPKEWSWIDSTVEMETRHPVEGSFGSEFLTIDNHCRVMAVWSCKMLKIFQNFLHSFGKTTPYGKIFKILFQKFSLRHWSTCCVQISWNLADGKSCVAYLTKRNKLLPLYSSRYCADRAQNLPGPAPDNALTSAPDFIQIGSLSVEL